MMKYSNPYEELKNKENVLIAFDYNESSRKIVITLLNDSDNSIDNVIITSSTDELLINPIILPSHQLTTKEIFKVEACQNCITTIESLNGKFSINRLKTSEREKMGKSEFIQKLLFIINGIDYEVEVDLEKIVNTIIKYF